MTRYARGDGSKGSNKRIREEPTPWSELKFKKKKKENIIHPQDEKDFEGNFELEPIIEKEDEIITEQNIEEEKKAKKKNKKHEKENIIYPQDEEDFEGNFEIAPIIEKEDEVISEENIADKKPKKKKKTVTTRANNKKNSESNNEKKHGFITENGQRYKLFKDGKKKLWIDIPYEENEVMTLYNKFFILREAAAELDALRKNLETMGHTKKEITKKMMTRERRAHNKLRVQLMYKQINTIKSNSISDTALEVKAKPRNLKLSELQFEESEFMTKYEDYWVARNQVCNLKKIQEWKISRIISNRENGSTDMELTEEETQMLSRQMKKEKRREHLRLCRQMKNNKSISKAENQRVPQDTNRLEGRSKMTKFDGFSVTNESAERLTYLRDELKNKNFSEQEINETVKLERRKDERSLKKTKKLICFNCRQPGHTVAQCPQSETIEICFKCGSTEHMSRNCFKQSSFSHAECFHCQKTGHLARECPDNPNGLYPNGGSCRECDSVRHLVRDCPTIMEKKAGSYCTLKPMNVGDNPEEMDF